MRPNRDEYFLRMAELVATRSTCLRRNVGCVLVNARGHVLATGYNGVAAGLPHCNHERLMSQGDHGLPLPVEMSSGAFFDIKTGVSWDHACPGAHAPSGTNLDGCEAIHAEQNALLQCRDEWEIETCYCTASPCFSCVKLLMNTSCTRIVFLEPYSHDEKSKGLWSRHPNNRFWIHHPKTW
jgi:dCMP deaminase